LAVPQKDQGAANQLMIETSCVPEEAVMAKEKKSLEIPHTTKKQMVFFSWTKDILIYVIVLNLFVEFSPVVIIDSFTLSIFTALLLKIMIEIIQMLEHKVSEIFKANKVLRIFVIWLILFSSKFVILELVDIIFGQHVQLGQFLNVIFLVVALMLTRQVFRRIYQGLGKSKLPHQEASV
jgi:hypothetical protein